MNKQELCKKIIELVEPETTPDPEEYSDGMILEMNYQLAKEELKK